MIRVAVIAMTLLTLQLYPPTRIWLAGITAAYCVGVIGWLVWKGRTE